MKKLLFIAVSAFMMVSCQKEVILVNSSISEEKKLYDHFNISKIEKVNDFDLNSIIGFKKYTKAKKSNDIYESVEAIYYRDGNITYLLNNGKENNLIIHTSPDNELLTVKYINFDKSDVVDNNYTFAVSDDEGEMLTFNVVDGVIIVDESKLLTSKRYHNESFSQCMTRSYGNMTSDMIGIVTFGLFTGPILATMAVYCAY